MVELCECLSRPITFKQKLLKATTGEVGCWLRCGFQLIVVSKAMKHVADTDEDWLGRVRWKVMRRGDEERGFQA